MFAVAYHAVMCANDVTLDSFMEFCFVVCIVVVAVCVCVCVCGVRKPFTRMDYKAKRVEQKQWRAPASHSWSKSWSIRVTGLRVYIVLSVRMRRPSLPGSTAN